VIPTGATIGTDIVETVTQPSRTWKLDIENGRIAGMIDGVEAVRQAVYKTLQTKRFAHEIYDAGYGAELSGLIGQSRTFAESELRRRIREALLQDDRILDVTDVEIGFNGDAATVRFTVVSVFGTFQEEVTASV
jgi:hypothetical protein